MNNINLTGRLTRDPELRYSQSGTAIANFSLAVSREYNHEETDFIDCVAFGRTAEAVGTYMQKGSQIGVTGSLQIETFTRKDGTKGKAAKVVIKHFDFLSAKAAESPRERERSEWDSLGEEININAPAGAADLDAPF